MQRYTLNSQIQERIMQINEVLAPRHFAEGHPEPVVFQHYRRDVLDNHRPMGCIQVELSIRTLVDSEMHRRVMSITLDTNAHNTVKDGWLNFHAHIVNFEMQSKGIWFAPLTRRLLPEEQGDGRIMFEWLSKLYDKLLEGKPDE
jgi:hypothetical protein